MKTLIALAALALTAACGGASSSQQLSGQPAGGSTPSAGNDAHPPVAVVTQSPLRSQPAGPAVDAAIAPAPVPVHASSGASAAGTGSSGPGHISSPAPSPSARPTPTAVGGTVTVTDDDNGITVRLAVGQRLRVRLSRGTWDPPTSSNSAVVVRRTSSGGYPSDQPVDAMFDAAARGGADVTAQSDAACFHTEPHCMMPSQQWQVTVVVR